MLQVLWVFLLPLSGILGVALEVGESASLQRGRVLIPRGEEGRPNLRNLSQGRRSGFFTWTDRSTSPLQT
jgi:hypothetical protein